MNIQLLLKEQINIVKTTISNFNESISRLRVSEKQINDNIDKLNSVISQQETVNKNQELNTEILEHLSLVGYLLNELEIEFNEIISIILFVKKNIVHPSLMSPETMLIELRKSIQSLPSGKALPLELTIDKMNLYLEISKIQYAYKTNKLIFVINFQIIDETSYNMVFII